MRTVGVWATLIRADVVVDEVLCHGWIAARRSVAGTPDAWPLGIIPGKEAGIVSHQQVRLDSLNQVETDADDDEQPSTTQELGDHEGNLELVGHDRRYHRYNKIDCGFSREEDMMMLITA